MKIPTVTIVDYGAGNLRSVAKAFEATGHPVQITDNEKDILKANVVIFPGQGASGPAMNNLRNKNLTNAIVEVINNGVPFFGVCLGLQLLLEYSEEGSTTCLGVAAGKTVLLPPGVKTPHMGWNSVELNYEHPVFTSIRDGEFFYFVHSYYGTPDNKDIVLGTTQYGVRFCSVLAKDNIVATQFHPEKSGSVGLKLYENFLKFMT